MHAILRSLVVTWTVASVGSLLLTDARAVAADESDSDHASTAHDDATHGATAQGSEEHGTGEHAAGEPNPLKVNVDLAVWTLIVFLVLLGVLWKFAWGPIMDALDARERYVGDNIAAAEAKHEEAKQLIAAHQAQLDKAADEVRGLLEEARRDAEATKSQIVAEAKQAADDERVRALRDIEQATDAAMKRLAERTANVAVDLASSAVQQSLTPDIQSRMVRDAMEKFADTAS